MAESLQQAKERLLSEEAQVATRKKTATKTVTREEVKQDEKFADIENNTFVKIVFSQATPEEKVKLIAQALTYSQEQTKEENETRLKEFILFKEYLQSERKRMAQEIIALTDTEAFSEMQSMYKDMNAALVEFDESLSPLTEIIDAVYKLRMQGGDVTLGVYKEIMSDKAAEAERIRKQEELEARLRATEEATQQADAEIRFQQTQKSFFGLGGIKGSAKRVIVEQEIRKEQAAAEAETIRQEVAALQNASLPESQYAHLAAEKAKLRELLDISSDDHKERQKRLVAAAQDFVNTTEARVGSVLEHFDEMGTQMDTLFDANRGMQSIYAIVADASKEARRSNTGISQALTAPEGVEEDKITEMKRENQRVTVNDFITAMDNTNLDSVKTYADLAAQGSRIVTMRQANTEQVSKAREMQSSGVAGVADGLSSALTIVSAAALGESAAMAGNTIGMMNDRTNVQSMQESLRQAAGIKDKANSLEKAIDDLAAYRDVNVRVTTMTREGLEQISDATSRIKGVIDEMSSGLNERLASNAETPMDEDDAPSSKAANDDKKPAPKKQGSGLGDIAKLGQGA